MPFFFFFFFKYGYVQVQIRSVDVVNHQLEHDVLELSNII